MQQIAGRMKLFPGMKEEYKRRHDNIWPELAAELKNAGIYDYTIWLDEETDTLFYTQKRTDNNTAAELRTKEIMKKWWNYMADIMETNPDRSPVVKPLTLMFRLD